MVTQLTYRNIRRLHTVSFTMTVLQQTPLHFLFHWRTVRRIPAPWTRLRTPASHSGPKPGPNTIIPSGSFRGSPPDAPLSLPSTSFPSHYSQITRSGGAIYRVTILSDNCHHCCTRLRVTAGSATHPPWVGLQVFQFNVLKLILDVYLSQFNKMGQIVPSTGRHQSNIIQMLFTAHDSCVR